MGGMINREISPEQIEKLNTEKSRYHILFYCPEDKENDELVALYDYMNELRFKSDKKFKMCIHDEEIINILIGYEDITKWIIIFVSETPENILTVLLNKKYIIYNHIFACIIYTKHPFFKIYLIEKYEKIYDIAASPKELLEQILELNYDIEDCKNVIINPKRAWFNKKNNYDLNFPKRQLNLECNNSINKIKEDDFDPQLVKKVNNLFFSCYVIWYDSNNLEKLLNEEKIKKFKKNGFMQTEFFYLNKEENLIIKLQELNKCLKIVIIETQNLEEALSLVQQFRSIDSIYGIIVYLNNKPFPNESMYELKNQTKKYLTCTNYKNGVLEGLLKTQYKIITFKEYNYTKNNGKLINLFQIDEKKIENLPYNEKFKKFLTIKLSSNEYYNNKRIINLLISLQYIKINHENFSCYNKNENFINFIKAIKNMFYIEEGIPKEMQIISYMIYNGESLKQSPTSFSNEFTNNEYAELKMFLLNILKIFKYLNDYNYTIITLSYSELKGFFEYYKKKIYLTIIEECKEDRKLLFELTKEITEKIENKLSILDENDYLKGFHILLIKFLFGMKHFGKRKSFYEERFFIDLTFTVKFLVFIIGKKLQLSYEDFPCLDDRRLMRLDLRMYIAFSQKDNISLEPYLNRDEQEKMKNTLMTKDFLIIGEKNFSQNIKNILKENNIKCNSIQDFSSNNILPKEIIKDIGKYLDNKNIDDLFKDSTESENAGYRVFSYYIILNVNDAEKLYTDLIILLTLYLVEPIFIIMIDDKRTWFEIEPFLGESFDSQFIFVYNKEELLQSLNTENLILPDYFKEDKKDKEYIENFLQKRCINNNFHKIRRNENKKGLELVESANFNFIENYFMKNEGNLIMVENFQRNIFLAFIENNMKKMFIEHYCTYFGFSCTKTLINNSYNMIRKFILAYIMDEKNNNNLSVYRIINRDLRSNNQERVKRYNDIIIAINSYITNNILAKYEGDVYRVSFLIENEMEKWKEGTLLYNTTFWSCTKKKEKVKNFMSDRTNVLIYAKVKYKNIDITENNLQIFDEQEVLNLPYSRFKIKAIRKNVSFEGRLLTKIKLEEVESENKFELENHLVLDFDK